MTTFPFTLPNGTVLQSAHDAGNLFFDYLETQYEPSSDERVIKLADCRRSYWQLTYIVCFEDEYITSQEEKDDLDFGTDNDDLPF